jgi:hypothetical protein
MDASRGYSSNDETISCRRDKIKAPAGARGWDSICQIRWRDQNQIEHTAVFQAFEESPLYQISEGDTLDIRFNPASPSEYYLPGLIQSTT